MDIIPVSLIEDGLTQERNMLRANNFILTTNVCILGLKSYVIMKLHLFSMVPMSMWFKWHISKC